MIERAKFARIFTALMLSRLQMDITEELIAVWYDGLKDFDDIVVEKAMSYFMGNGGNIINLPMVKDYARSILPSRFMISERTRLTDAEIEYNKKRISELVQMICDSKTKESV